MAIFNRLAVLSLLVSAALLSAADAPAIYTIQTVAGNDSIGDGGLALSALLTQAEGIAVDQGGNVYIADAGDHRVRKITADGTIQTLAGNGVAGFAGDGGPAAAALLNQPYGVAVDPAGNVYIADLGNARVRKISVDGTIETIAGGGASVPGAAISAPAINSQLLEPRNVAVDPDGTLYISDFAANSVYKVSPGGALSLLAGSGNAGFSGDGSLATLGQLKAPAGIASDKNGNIYVADSGNNRVRKISQGLISSVYSVVAPTGLAISSGGTLYIAAPSYFGTISKGIAGLTPAMDVAIDPSGNIYASEGQFVRKVIAGGAVVLIAGSGASRTFGGDGGQATAARLHTPAGVAVDSAGNTYIADSANHRIRRISAAGIISTFAGTGDAGSKGDNGSATLAQLNDPQSVALDSAGNLYIADTGNNALRKITPGGVISTVSTQLNGPSYVAVAPDQSIYIADTGNNRLVRFTSSPVPSTVTQLLAPTAVAIDPQGDVFATGQTNLLKLTPAGSLAVKLDGLNAPRGLAVMRDGSVLIAESGANLIRRVSPSGAVSVIAGTGVAGFSGEEGVATAAQLNAPQGLAVDAKDAVWIADSSNNRVRVLTPMSGPADSLAPMTLLNAASMASGPVAPGEIVTVFGAGFQPNQTQVLFDGTPATLFYTGSNQINALAPAQFASATSTLISITVSGLTIAAWSNGVAAAAPGIFTAGNGTGQAAVVNQDGSINSAANPAARGSVVSFYATGQGSGPGAVSLTIGNYPAQLLYAGPAPGFPGLMQINAQIPGGFLAPGVQPVALAIGSASSQSGVTIAVQ